jgi:hypothetical protein
MDAHSFEGMRRVVAYSLPEVGKPRRLAGVVVRRGDVQLVAETRGADGAPGAIETPLLAAQDAELP